MTGNVGGASSDAAERLNPAPWTTCACEIFLVQVLKGTCCDYVGEEKGRAAGFRRAEERKRERGSGDLNPEQADPAGTSTLSA